jgi:hypothetical protein|tara:strand:+ start:74 stop:334 length:261 start_codon:yes stop_codon:yes gene_type:complete
MCFGRPKPPPLPDPEPVDSAIEPTARKVAIGDDRTMGQPKVKMKRTGQKVTGGRIARAIAPRRLGTRSLQIPLLVGRTKAGNLNYS